MHFIKDTNIIFGCNLQIGKSVKGLKGPSTVGYLNTLSPPQLMDM